MKRKISLIIALMLILSSLTNIWAAVDLGVADEAAEKTGPLMLSLEDAVKLAVGNDRGMWEIDKTIGELQDLKRQGKDAKDLYELLSEQPLSQSSIEVDYVYLILSKNNYFSKNADLKTKELHKGREQLLKAIEIDTVSSYYKVLVAEKTIEINEVNLNKSNEQLRVINLKFNNGSATKAEVLSAEMAVQQAKTDLDSASDDLNIAKLDLLNKLSLPLDQEVVLTDTELTYVPTTELNLEESIEKAKAERLEIISLRII